MIRGKIAIVIGSLGVGGAENMVLELAKNINYEKYLVKVFVIHGRCNSLLESEFEKFKITVKYFNGRQRVNFKGLYSVWTELSKFNPDIIHTHIDGTIYSIPWVFFHKLTMLITLHTIPSKAFNKKTQCVILAMLKLNRAQLVAVSKENYELGKSYYRISNNKINLVNNGIDLDKYYRINHTIFTFINVGRFNNVKNQKLIIQAFHKFISKFGNGKLILVGDGEERENLENLSKSLNIDNFVEFTGFVSNVEDFLAVSDVYIQSSHREGLPLAVLEGMASRLPVISTDVGGMKDIIHSNGFLIQDNNLKQLTETMDKLYLDNSLREELANNSYSIVQAYSSKMMANKYCEIYDKIK
ncbi:MAG: glycosyltransferase [Pleomorphochaeta sp.]